MIAQCRRLLLPPSSINSLDDLANWLTQPECLISLREGILRRTAAEFVGRAGNYFLVPDRSICFGGTEIEAIGTANAREFLAARDRATSDWHRWECSLLVFAVPFQRQTYRVRQRLPGGAGRGFFAHIARPNLGSLRWQSAVF